MKIGKRVFTDCIKKNIPAILLFIIMTALNSATFLLYDIMIEPFIYSEILIGFILLVVLVLDYIKEYKAAKERDDLKRSILSGAGSNVQVGTLRDSDYLEMLSMLNEKISAIQTEFSVKRGDDEDYYTSWVHQIKTPIAIMKLMLTDDIEKDRELLAELFRIEQYVEMVLDYIRLESDTNDLVISEYLLDDLIKETLRKFARQFVLRKLRLSYEPTDVKIVTDKKWFSFMLDQLISNAIKYTQTGEIGIVVSEDKVTVTDTGIGIAPEDLPRIFEKGYTGVNGRLGQKSSGLGLFLTGKVAKLLAIKVTCESTVGKGSSFTIHLNKQ